MIDVVILVGAFLVAALVLRGVQAWLNRPGEAGRAGGVRARVRGAAAHRWRPRRG